MVWLRFCDSRSTGKRKIAPRQGESSVKPEHSKELSFECGGSTPLLRFLFDGQKKGRSATGESSVKPEHSKVLSLECGGSTPLLRFLFDGQKKSRSATGGKLRQAGAL
jgi:hypothetical protein